MSFRCLFIIRELDVDNNDLQPYCYKPFNNIIKTKCNDEPNSVPLKNFNEWYNCVLETISTENYTSFNGQSINDYLCNPIYKVQTDFELLDPCIIINKNNFVFGGLLYIPVKQTSKINIKYQFGSSVDFISVMTSYFLNIINKTTKIKISDLLMEFYYFIKIMCPYGTPVTSNSNLVEYFKNSENILKSITVPSLEKSVLSINQLPSNLVNKNKELKITVKEVVTGVQHENKNGQAKHDIDIIGEVILSASNFSSIGEVAFTLKSTSNHKFFSKAVLTDLLLHPSCLSCNYQTPATISMLNRKPTQDLLEKVDDNSPNSPSFYHDNPLVSKRYTSIDSITLSRRLQSISVANSANSNANPHKLQSSISVKVKPWSDPYSLLSYKIMQYSIESDIENISIPFVASCKSPEPPIICSYQLEDVPGSIETVCNIIFRIRLNPNVFQIGEKQKPIEFSKFEVYFPFHNRPSIFDANKCNVSQGKIVVLEQNRHIMMWQVGTILKRNEATLMGSVKFQSDSNEPQLVDKFCIQSNAYVQVHFTLKSGNLSGISLDTRNISFSADNGVKIIQKQECTSHNFKVWNSLGLCPIEISN